MGMIMGAGIRCGTRRASRGVPFVHVSFSLGPKLSFFFFGLGK